MNLIEQLSKQYDFLSLTILTEDQDKVGSNDRLVAQALKWVQLIDESLGDLNFIHVQIPVLISYVTDGNETLDDVKVSEVSEEDISEAKSTVLRLIRQNRIQKNQDQSGRFSHVIHRENGKMFLNRSKFL